MIPLFSTLKCVHRQLSGPNFSHSCFRIKAQCKVHLSQEAYKSMRTQCRLGMDSKQYTESQRSLVLVRFEPAPWCAPCCQCIVSGLFSGESEVVLCTDV